MKLLNAPRRVACPCVILAGLLLAGQAGAQPADPGELRARAESIARIDLPGSREARLHQAVLALYEAHGHAPFWTEPARRAALLAELEGTRADGLEPEDYALSRLRASWAPASGPAASDPESELLGTRACLRALRDLFRGKTEPKALDSDWNFADRPFEGEGGLGAVVDALDRGDVQSLFDRARPQHPVYGRLRAALAGLRALEAQGGWPVVPAGPTLKPGMSDPRVPVLRQRLAAAGYLPSAEGGDAYDAELEAAVRAFQAEQYLAVDGALGPVTQAALAVPAAARVDQLRVNLERARWLLHEMHDDFVLVDLAGFKLRVYRGATLAWTTRVQVGKPYRRTPSFKSELRRVTFNPTWTIPPTILRNDTLPRVRKDPGYLAKNRIRVLDARGDELAPGAVDWKKPNGVTLRQDAGPGNALGRLAIRFPNPYAIYMHDTPHQELFDSPARAFSSGCIRVEDPRRLVELLFDDPERWSRAEVDRLIDQGETLDVDLPKPVALLIAYWSVDLLEGGRVAYKRDIYGRDPPLLRALDAKPREGP